VNGPNRKILPNSDEIFGNIRKNKILTPKRDQDEYRKYELLKPGIELAIAYGILPS
jgi:hypothetical protein